jgi:hypothetical protein
MEGCVAVPGCNVFAGGMEGKATAAGSVVSSAAGVSVLLVSSFLQENVKASINRNGKNIGYRMDVNLIET